MKTILKGRPKSYQILKCLSENSNSRIVRALCRERDLDFSEEVVLKFIRSENLVQDFVKELESLKQVRSTHCVTFYNWEKVSGDYVLVLESIDGINLKKLVSQIQLRPRLVHFIVREIHKGLLDLKKFGLSHGDLSPSNVMIDRNGNVKLIDYGMANGLGRYTPSFTAPEVLANGNYTYFSDLYSLGQLTKFMGVHSKYVEMLLKYRPEERKFVPPPSHSHFKKLLALKVLEVLEGGKGQKTRKILEPLLKKGPSLRSQNVTLAKLSAFVKMIFFVFGLYIFLSLSGSSNAKGWSEISSYLTVISSGWLEIRVNGGSSEYAPIFLKKISSGRVQLEWLRSEEGKRATFTVLPGEHKIISDTDTLQ